MKYRFQKNCIKLQFSRVSKCQLPFFRCTIHARVWQCCVALYVKKYDTPTCRPKWVWQRWTETLKWNFMNCLHQSMIQKLLDRTGHSRTLQLNYEFRNSWIILWFGIIIAFGQNWHLCYPNRMSVSKCWTSCYRRCHSWNHILFYKFLGSPTMFLFPRP